MGRVGRGRWEGWIGVEWSGVGIRKWMMQWWW